MAARHSTEDNIEERRQVMVEMRLRGLPYSLIARKFGIAKNSARAVVIRAIGMEKANEKGRHARKVG
jgi:DNA-directed RNA polymerase specialized sigma24 family protein